MHSLSAPPIPLPALVERPATLREGLASHPPDAQRAWMQGLGLWQLRALWRLAERDPQPFACDDLVHGDGVTICKGKNHLPVFAWFEKRFARVGDQIVGYNETGWQKLFVGPGHFVVRASDVSDEVLIDYGTTPSATHPDFPPLRDNSFGWPGPLAPVVYGGGMVDKVRRVSPHLLIGKAVPGGALSLQGGAFFALFLPG